MKKDGFSLIELLVVITIIGILFGLVSTALVGAKKSAVQKERNLECQTIKTAIRNYRYDHSQWPCPLPSENSPAWTNSCYSNDNHIVIFQYLMNGNKKYLSLGNYKFDANSNIVDREGNPYIIKMNFEDDTVTVQ